MVLEGPSYQSNVGKHQHSQAGEQACRSGPAGDAQNDQVHHRADGQKKAEEHQRIPKPRLGNIPRVLKQAGIQTHQ